MRLRILLYLAGFLATFATTASAADFDRVVKPLIQKYCVQCHNGKDANPDVDFLKTMQSQEVGTVFEIWESAVKQLRAGTMPPDTEPQPTQEERKRVIAWFDDFVQNIEARPAVFQPRRLAVNEYRNTLHSVLGFDLEVAIIEAEQTLAERSLVVKLLPTDPPGKSGFKNDTHSNRLTTVAWDQYSYLVDAGLEQLFQPHRRKALEVYTGRISEDGLTVEQAQQLIKKVLSKARRRKMSADELEKAASRVGGLSGNALVGAVKFELKTILMSPAFIYRGLLISGQRGKRQRVDSYELAERLSYFLWADMPNETLFALAADDSIQQPEVLKQQIDRMLLSPKARSLTADFATQWLTINEIEKVSNNPPQMVALKSQPLDFMHYLFTNNRPLLEMIDSETAFINPHTSRMYGRDAKQMKRYVKQKGIEVEIVANQKIRLEATKERGGILTMPGILAMNRGPILRGTWILERILGDELPEPPANIGQVPPNTRGEKLTFRQRFEKHRSKAACAIWHDKIDPLGFALQDFDNSGKYLRSANYQPSKKQKRKQQAPNLRDNIDTQGKLPSGETFENMSGLKQILVTSQREAVIRNVVERTMSYALCRKLVVYDRPSVDMIVKQMDESNGTWRDLFYAVANSVPFREMILSNAE